MKQILCILLLCIPVRSSELAVISSFGTMKKGSKVISWLVETANDGKYTEILQWTNREKQQFSYRSYDNRGRKMEDYPKAWKLFYEAYDTCMDPRRCNPSAKGYYTNAKGRFHNALSRLLKSHFLYEIRKKQKVQRCTHETIYGINRNEINALKDRNGTAIENVTPFTSVHGAISEEHKQSWTNFDEKDLFDLKENQNLLDDVYEWMEYLSNTHDTENMP